MIYHCNITQDGDRYDVEFPDMPNAMTCGFSFDEALYMAKDALDAILETYLIDGYTIPGPKYHSGYAIEVAPHIAIAIHLRDWRGNETQASIAQRLGMKYQSYQRLEDPSKSNPTIKTLEKIAALYGKPVESLIA
jgi:antitoxin HicB